jgi:tripartite ATP-independent transporter DctP family solute receptor
MAAILVFTMIVSAGCSRGGSSDEGSDGSDLKVTIRLAHDVSDTHPSAIACQDIFKKQVEEKSNGNITVEIYGNSALGTVAENIEAMKIGDLEMAWASDAPISISIPEWNLVGLPFLFTSVDNAHAAFDGDFGKELDKLLEDGAGIINLGWGDVGFRNITNSKKAIKTPEDLAGIKIRTMTNELHVEYFTAIGAVPTPMSFSELFTALQQKTVDGQENPTAMIWNNKLYEVQDYLTISEHIWSAAPIIIAKDFFESLPEDYQKIIQDAATESRDYNRSELTKQNKDLQKNIADAGLEVTVLTAKEKEAFQKIAEDSVWKTAATKYGQELIDIAKKYNK